MLPEEQRITFDIESFPSKPSNGSNVIRLPQAEPSYSPAFAADSFEPRHVLDYVRVLYKRRWLAASVFIAVFVATALYTFTRVPVYQASVRLLIDPQRQNYGFKEVAAGPDYQTLYAILRSRSLAKKTMQTLGIWHESAGSAPQPAVKARDERAAGGLLRKLTDLIGVTTPAAPPVVERGADETTAEARQIDGFVAGLTIAPVPGSGIVDVIYTSGDPAAAAQYANALVKEFVEQNLEFKSVASREVSDWLADRMVEQRAKVEASERALQQYRERNGVVSLDERGTTIVQGLADLTASATKARTERIEKEALYNQLRAVQSNRAALESFPPIATNASVQQARADLSSAQRLFAQLSEKLGERHPDLIRAREAVRSAEERLSAEVAKVADGIRLDFEKARTTEAGLAQTVETQKREALASNRSGVELAVLLRDVESNRQVLQTMMDKAKEAGISGEIKTNNMRVLDAAEPPRAPVSPNTRRNMQYGVLGGLVCALGLVFLFEYMDNRIKSPEEIKSELGVAFLGMVPATTRESGATATPLLSNGVPPRFSEAFRGVRTNVVFSAPEEGTRIVLVTSAGPGEGKTAVAANLAIALAQTGQRVMVIDGDLRRPRVHDVFKVKQEPGLSNLIVGDAKAADVIQPSSTGVTVLPAGRIPPNPAELLGSKRFRELIMRLGEHFDWIVVDSPPVMAVTDAAVIGHLASGVLFVTSADKTNRHTARLAIEQLMAGRSRVLGAVLNRVELDRNPYYYSQYYRREYGGYYYKES